MPRFKIKLAYNGRGYSGFQEQPRKPTIQRTLEAALKKILREKARVIPSGRTDAGVHAIGQVCHVDFGSQKALQRISRIDMAYSLNAVLPDGIRVSTFKRCAATFHARNSAKKKCYAYHILISRTHNPFLKGYVWCVHAPLDETAMREAASYLIGRHDFSTFCASDSDVQDKSREIHDIQFLNSRFTGFFRQPHEKFLTIEFTGDGFLKQMVRNIVGTLVAVGQSKIRPTEVKGILKSKDRRQAFITAPAQGLFLKHVWYGKK